MKAIIINACGDSSVLERVEIDNPTASNGEVVIEVKATSVNPVDWKMRNGFGRFLIGGFPAVLHADCAGIVSEVGPGVSNFAVGDEVYSFATGMMGKPGALAEYMAADARMVARKPASLSFEEAACLPLVWTTASFALLQRTEIRSNSTLLVQGGTGGVGSMAVQLAAAKLNVAVYATCGTDEKCQVAESLGAKKAFNYRCTSAEDMSAEATGGKGFDVVFNTVGEAAINASVAACGFDSTIIDINGAFPTPPNAFQFQQMSFLSVFAGHPITHGLHQEKVGEFLDDLAKLVDEGKVKPLLDSTRFDFATIGAAHDYQEHSSPVGKIAVSAKW